MEILTSVKRLYISFKSLVNDFVYSFGRAALLLLVEVYNHTVPIRERGRIRVNTTGIHLLLSYCVLCITVHSLNIIPLILYIITTHWSTFYVIHADWIFLLG